MAESRLLARTRIELDAGRQVGARILAGTPPAVITGFLLAAAEELRRQHGARAAYDFLQQAADHAARPLVQTNRGSGSAGGGGERPAGPDLVRGGRSRPPEGR